MSLSSLVQNHQQWKQDLQHQELRVATIAALSQQIKGKIFVSLKNSGGPENLKKSSQKTREIK